MGVGWRVFAGTTVRASARHIAVVVGAIVSALTLLIGGATYLIDKNSADEAPESEAQQRLHDVVNTFASGTEFHGYRAELDVPYESVALADKDLSGSRWFGAD